MSKFIYLALTIFISVNSVSQNLNLPELNFEDYTFPKSVVINVEGKNQSQLKTKIESWMKTTYSKSTLISSEFLDQTFLITAKENRLLKVKNLTSDLRYQLKISLRDNRYRFEVSSISYSYYTEYRPIANINLIKDEIIKRDLLESKSTLASFFNNLNSELFDYIKNDSDDW